MQTENVSVEMSESAHQTRGLFAYCVASLNELDSAEALIVAREAARDLILMMTDLHPAPTETDRALTELSTLCQHGIVAHARRPTEVPDPD